MKRLIVISLSLLAVLALAGCSSGQQQAVSTQNPSTSNQQSQNDGPAKFEIVSIEKANNDSSGYVDVDIKAKNISDKEQTLYSVSIDAIDENGDIARNYRSSSKHSVELVLAPGQSGTIDFSVPESEDMAGIRIRTYDFGDSLSQTKTESFNEPVTVMFE